MYLDPLKILHSFDAFHVGSMYNCVFVWVYVCVERVCVFDYVLSYCLVKKKKRKLCAETFSIVAYLR